MEMSHQISFSRKINETLFKHLQLRVKKTFGPFSHSDTLLQMVQDAQKPMHALQANQFHRRTITDEDRSHPLRRCHEDAYVCRRNSILSDQFITEKIQKNRTYKAPLYKHAVVHSDRQHYYDRCYHYSNHNRLMATFGSIMNCIHTFQLKIPQDYQGGLKLEMFAGCLSHTLSCCFS